LGKKIIVYQPASPKANQPRTAQLVTRTTEIPVCLLCPTFSSLLFVSTALPLESGAS